MARYTAYGPQRLGHGIKRSEDHNSIIRTRLAPRGVERVGHRHEGARCRAKATRVERGQKSLGRGGALGLRSGDEPAIDAPTHGIDDALDVLVGEHPEDGGRAFEKAHVAEPLGERARGVRIVRDVQDDRGPARQHLETAGKAREREAALDLADR